MASIPRSFDARTTQPPISGISYISKSIPTNTATCKAGSTVFFRLPGGLPTSYLANMDSFIKYTVKNKRDDGNNLTLSPAGGAGLIERLRVSQNSAVLSEQTNYGAYRALEQSLTSDNSYLSGMGNAINGTVDHEVGETINAGESRTFIEPLCHQGSLFGQSKVIPLKGQALEYAVTFGSYNYGCKWVNAGATNNDLEIDSIEIVLNIIQLSDESEAMVASLGDWSVLAKGVATVNSSVSAGVGGHTANVGASYSQVLAVQWVQTDNSASVNHDTALVNTDFIKNNVERWGFSIDGVLVEAQKLVKADTAELVAMSAVDGGFLSKVQGVPESLSKAHIEGEEGSTNVFTMSLELFQRCTTPG